MSNISKPFTYLALYGILNNRPFAKSIRDLNNKSSKFNTSSHISTEMTIDPRKTVDNHK